MTRGKKTSGSFQLLFRLTEAVGWTEASLCSQPSRWDCGSDLHRLFCCFFCNDPYMTFISQKKKFGSSRLSLLSAIYLNRLIQNWNFDIDLFLVSQRVHRKFCNNSFFVCILTWNFQLFYFYTLKPGRNVWFFCLVTRPWILIVSLSPRVCTGTCKNCT